MASLLQRQRSPSDGFAARRRARYVATGTLGLVMAAHMLLETARDALFLANVAVERLPFATIAIAALALLAAFGGKGASHRGMLVALQGLAALGTAGFFLLTGNASAWTYYALYVWSGIITSVIVVRFWLVLGDLFTITEGKRDFATIAMGGAVGAVVGSGIAALLAPRVGGEGLLVASAALYASSMLGPLFSLRPRAEMRAVSPKPEADSELPSELRLALRNVLRDDYTRRIATMVIAGGVTITLGDYLFKSVLAAEVAPELLATMLSRIYLGLNALSIVTLAVGVTPLLSRLGVDRSLAILPVLTGVAALGIVAGGSLGAIVLLKAADGTLRHSLHKTATELLYLPMSSCTRSSVKGAIDLAGHTAARGLASLAVLALVMLPDARMAVAIAAVASAGFWAFTALRIRGSYLDVFRATLRDGTIETELDHPELDLDSATSLVAALSDPDERRVIAAMRILVERGRAALIPSLILYHPSPEVVIQALDLFSRIGRENLMGALQHLIDHPDGSVRAAAVRATWTLTRDAAPLRGLRQSDCAAVRVSAVSALHSAGEVDDDEYVGVLDDAIHAERFEPRLAAAMAAELFYHPASRRALVEMARDEDASVAASAVRAIHASADAWFTPHLVDLLDDRRIRGEVRDALIARGDEALEALERRLLDPDGDDAVLRHVPRTIARFASPRAAEILMRSLSGLESGTARYKVLRGLEMLRMGSVRGLPVDPAIVSTIDARRLRQECERVLRQSEDRLALEHALVRVLAEATSQATASGELLVELLRDKRALAVGRIFKLLGLMRPAEDFRVIEAGLESDDPKDRASAQELLESLLPRDVARPLLTLIAGGLPDDHPRTSELGSYADILARLASGGSRTLAAVALYHAGEVGLEREAGEWTIEVASDGGAPEVASEQSLQERALSILRDLSGRRGLVRPSLAALLAR